ncbi:MAG TPA: polysaccharide pyruvyl transferase family protein [Firmicutes bacterium]|nr:polysaccharide pyruvyl transferase family protein [Bacillota bacterium]
MEKRIGIINHWMVNNYGALLLAYALERKLRELGYNVETISWLPDEVKKPWKLSMIKKTGLIHYLLRLGYFSVFVLPRERSFSHFRSLMSTSKEKYSDTTLPNISQKYDKIIIGGDQLWNCKINYFNINNFLPFIHERNRKVVYAASLAQDEMRKGFREEFRQLAMGFGYITTRERRGKEIIEEITGLSAPRVADPAFLLTADDWAELAIEPKEKEKYIFVYQVQYDAVVTQFAQKIAKEKGLKVIYCPFPIKKQISCVRKPYLTPEEWLGYIKNAEYIFTDAFHGLVFSIIFNKQFAVEISEYGKDTHSRITNLLELLGLEDRLFSENHYFNIDNVIDYEMINNYIIKDREQSIKHINMMLQI